VFHGGNEFVDGVLDADGNATGDFGLCAVEKFPERKIFLFGFGVPDGGFDGGFGHVVSANVFEKRPDVRGGGELLPFQHGPKILREDVPAGFGVFGRIEGIFAGGAFAPADGAVDVGFGEDDAAFGDAIHAGFEGMQKFEMNFAQSELAKLHGESNPSWGRRY